jgi:hypothetical protein
MNRSLVSSLFAVLLSLSACAADDVRVDRGCVTQCDRFHQECLATSARLCETCLRASLELGISCSSQCGNRCPGGCPSTGACVERPWRVVADNQDLALRTACDLARSQLDTCGRREELTDCAKASRFERPEAVSVYQCIAATPCRESHAHCIAALSVGTLGAELQAKASVCAWTGYTAEQVQALNQWEGWLRPSASRAARECLSQRECADAAACIDALFANAL